MWAMLICSGSASTAAPVSEDWSPLRTVARVNSAPTTAFGFGLSTVVTSGASEGIVLDTWYPSPSLGDRPPGAEPPPDLVALAADHPARRVRTEVVTVGIDLGAPPADTTTYCRPVRGET